MDEVLHQLETLRLVPVIVLDEATSARPLAHSLLEGGLPIAEVTLRTPHALDVLAELATEPQLVVGAGTVVSPEQVDRAVAAGARFLVSPGLDDDVVARALELETPILPGAVTATEVQRALRLGLSTVKFFPAKSSGGAAAIAAMAAPFPQVRFVPTGGITASDLASYLDLSCVLAVGGSWMVSPALLARGKWGEVTRLVREAVSLAADHLVPAS